MNMEDNTGYVVRQSLRKLLPPMVFSGMSSTLGGVVVDFVMVSLFCGAEGLAVVALFYPLCFVWDAIGDVFGVGATTAFSIAKGERDLVKAQAVFSQSLSWLVLLLSLVASVSIVGNGALLSFFHLDAALRPAAAKYGIWTAISMVVCTLNNVLREFVNSDNRPKLAMACATTKVSLCLVLDAFFMGVLKTGVVGSLYAFCIACAVPALICTGAILSQRSSLQLQLGQLHLPTLISILKLSYLPLVENLGSGLTGMVFNRLLYIRFGAPALAILAMVLAAESLLTALYKSLAHASMQIVGVFFGERNAGGVKTAALTGLGAGLVAALGATGALLVYPDWIPAVFGFPSSDYLLPCNHALRCLALASMLSFTGFYAAAFFQTTERSGTTLALSLARNPILPLLSGTILLTLNQLNLFWFHYLLANALLVLLLAVVIGVIYRRALDPDAFWLNGAGPRPGLSYKFLIRAAEGTAQLNDYLEMQELFLCRHYFPVEVIPKLRLAMEELVVYAVGSVCNQNSFIDVHMRIEGTGSLKMSVSFDGSMAGSKNALHDGSPDDDLLGLRILRHLADEFYCDCIYGFTYIRATFIRGPGN
jgi:Na+-driven multidrug efflux pump